MIKKQKIFTEKHSDSVGSYDIPDGVVRDGIIDSGDSRGEQIYLGGAESDKCDSRHLVLEANHAAKHFREVTALLSLKIKYDANLYLMMMTIKPMKMRETQKQGQPPPFPGGGHEAKRILRPKVRQCIM